MSDQFEPSSLSRLNRRPERGSHDKEAVYTILDAAIVCHIGYVADGQAYATPTLFWRDGDVLYWHGSKHGRMIRAHSAQQRVCVTVSHLDALNLGRSGIASSIQYRSVMALGTTQPIIDATEKRIQMAKLIDRQFSGRASELRPIHDHEIDQITVIRMPIDEATAKVKTGGVVERGEEDYEVAAWAGVIPIAQTIGQAVPDHRLLVGPGLPTNVAAYGEGRRLDQVLSEAVRTPQDSLTK
jgi:nitroimidazol reductase NimA-like FMN-containing flavoprotein (pyridoxamine 5'-phosphate oxidase superfamily)